MGLDNDGAPFTTESMIAVVKVAKTRDDVVLPYRATIHQYQSGDHSINYVLINRAIMERWSESALTYIKRKAWGR